MAAVTAAAATAGSVVPVASQDAIDTSAIVSLSAAAGALSAANADRLFAQNASPPQTAKGYWHKHPGVPTREKQVLRRLNKDQVSSFDRDGFLLIKSSDVWSAEELRALISSVDEMQTWPDKPGAWMKYYEADRRDPSAPKLLNRVENFLQFAPSMDQVCRGEKLMNIAADLFGEESILFKEKVNMKLPGGGGFNPHQDVAAGWWLYQQKLHLSCLVCIDPATVENGCLEVVRAAHLGGMMSEDWHELPESVYTKLKFEHVPTQPGDVLFFDSYVPHRSAPNNTDKSRRLLYLTYAKAAEGDWRERYYADKRASYPPDCEREPGKVYQYKV